ncbi:hypothetical protein WICPIJ_009219 [Wickerhamomyces pijperi]|uniref:Oligomycin resistance ATP-dependent permease YOR1 n=1 Tax=Wickerhamomyces pijperi TaxID=599730 RepID=A0A9P8PPI7_WICPI|nr:hypothetical protein WICPIJ_009219 [Wickerhamomyces pijperi]
MNYNFKTSSDVDPPDSEADMLQADIEANTSSIDKGQPSVQPELVQRIFTPLLLSKKVPPIPDEEERTEFPAYKGNWISRILLLWLLPLYKTGYLRTVTQQDLWTLGDEFQLEKTYPKFQKIFEQKVADYRSKNPDSESLPYSIIAFSLFQCFRFKCLMTIFLKNVADCLMAFSPLVTKHLISFVEERTIDSSIPVGKGIGLTFGVCLMLLARTLIEAQSNLLSFHIGGESRTLLTKMILEKSFISTVETKHKFSNGVLLSFLSNDISRIDLALSLLPELTAFLIPTVVAIVLLIVNMKESALAGIAVFLLVLVSIGAPMQVMMSIRDKANVHTDKRVELVREIVQSIKVIKFYSWEDAYDTIVKVVRANEIQYVFKIQILISVVVAIALSASPIVTMVAVLVYHKVSDGRNPAVIFSSMTLFAILNFKMITLTMSLSSGADGLNAIRRLMKYFQCKDEDPAYLDTYYDSELLKGHEDIAIKIENAEFQWLKFEDISKPEEEQEKGEKPKKDSEKETEIKESRSEYVTILKSINLEIIKGEFVVITGPIGSGKSSLLAALSGIGIHKAQGKIAMNGSSLLCGTPWIQNSTIRDNVLFGQPMDQAKYNQVISACCLDRDIEQLPAGDLTEIGERGVNLSGGQKARLSLARVVYSDSDIVLLDDVLSAVDANVGKTIVENLLLGLIKGKTIVLATHQLSLTSKADRVVFVNGDGSIDAGSYESLASSNQKFRELLEYSLSNHDEEEEETDAKDQQEQTQKNEELKKLNLQKVLSLSENQLYEDEERAVNAIPLSTYVEYINSGRGVFGYSVIPLIFLFILLSIFCNLFSNVWLTYWLEDKFPSLNEGTYIGLYITFTFASVLFSIGEFGLESYVVVQASKILNLMAMSRLLHAPMWFFDTTPIGRIINRFSKDTNSLDNEIGGRLKVLVHMIGMAIGALVLAIVYVPWFAIVVPFIAFLLFACANCYQATSREVKRLEAINRSFILNNFNESISGGTTIKSFGSQHRFIARNSVFSDRLNEVYFVVVSNQRWISLSLDSLGVVALFIVSMMVITGVFHVSASAAGLLIYYMTDFSWLVSNILNDYVEFENDMNSVERLMQYAKYMAQEAPYRSSDMNPVQSLQSSWPESGAIEFDNVSLRYRENLPLVLNNLSIKIKESEKIGICGRTGAGKSSLMVALYRLSELSGGSITIDGVDISKIGLHDLRSKLSIIPQDPVLFEGTIRRNLDPFSEKTDAQLWDALRRSHLVKDPEAIQKTDKFHLDSAVVENGENFSLGERQLIALARALVRQTRILILDEATSSVDYETDHLIQTTIAEEFKSCTILCIAHRLKTIVGYDRILVLEKGRLEEFGRPLELYQREGGLFKEMCMSAKISEADFV